MCANDKREVKGNSLSMGGWFFIPDTFKHAYPVAYCDESERKGNEKREGKQSGKKVAESRWVDIGCILFIN